MQRGGAGPGQIALRRRGEPQSAEDSPRCAARQEKSRGNGAGLRQRRTKKECGGGAGGARCGLGGYEMGYV